MTSRAGVARFQIAGEVYVLLAAVLWGTTGTTQALAPAGAQSDVLGALRLVIGGAALYGIAWASGAFAASTTRERFALRPMIAGVIAIAAYQVLFFHGVRLTGVAIGTIVGIGSAPVVAGLLDALLARQTPSRRWLVATVLAIAGCVLLLLPDDAVMIDPLGVLAAVGAGAAYASYTLASKQIISAGHHPMAVMGTLNMLGGVVLLPVFFVHDLSWLATPAGVIVALHLGLIATALAYLLFGRGLLTVSAATAVTLTLAEPLTAGLLGVALVGEQLTPLALLGIGLIFAGLGALTLKRGQA